MYIQARKHATLSQANPLQITLFAAIMCLNKRREAARRLDVVLCFKSKREPNGGAFCGACGPRPKQRPSTTVMRLLGHVLSLKPVKVVVIVLWLAALAVGIAGTAQMRVEADVNNFIPDGSYLRCACALLTCFTLAEAYLTLRSWSHSSHVGKCVRFCSRDVLFTV